MEFDFLLACARTQVEPTLAEKIMGLAKSPLNWHELAQEAQKQGVMPLLYLNLCKICPDKVPVDILEQLAFHFRVNNLRNQVITRELESLVSILQANQIPVIPYKGPALAKQIYKDIGLRQFNDLDILIQEKDYFRVRSLLIDHGYLPCSPLDEKELHEKLSRTYQEKFKHQHRAVHLLELHWQIARPYPVSMQQYNPFQVSLEPVWERVETMPLDNQTVSIFSPSDLFYILCIHGAKDGWRSLKSLCDLHELLLIHPDLDIPEIINKAQSPEQVRVILLALSLLDKLFEFSFTPSVQTLIQSKAITQLTKTVCRNLHSPDPPQIISLSSQFSWTLRLLVTSKAKVSYTIWSITKHCQPTVKDKEWVLLPNFLSWAYFLVRPVRLLNKFLIKLWY